MSNTAFVVLAYGLTYIVLGGYALTLWNRRRRLERHWTERD